MTSQSDTFVVPPQSESAKFYARQRKRNKLLHAILVYGILIVLSFMGKMLYTVELN